MKALIAITMLLIISATQAYKGSISFTSSEKKNHARKTRKFTKIGKACLQNYKSSHENFFNSSCRVSRSGKRVCLSKYYGDRRYSKKRGQKRWGDGEPLEYLGDALRSLGFPESMMNQMENISCVGMALNCLKQSFNGTGQSKQWAKIKRYVYANHVDGTALQHALQKIGWTIHYWNPSPSWSIDEDTKAWDRQEANWKSKGRHNTYLRAIRNRSVYYQTKVDDKYSMVGFEKGTPQVLYSTPFWVGTAHGGYHVFPGTFQNVVEAHSTQPISARKNMEFSQFAPMKSGGGPRWTATQKYRSGMIALPPGY
jgi:hypothetical protein